MMLLLLKCLLGAAAVLAIALLSKSKTSFYLAGMVPLFPTFGLISHYIIASEQSIGALRTTALFGLYSLIPYAVYLCSVYALCKRFGLAASLGLATLAWLASAALVLMMWKNLHPLRAWNPP